MDKTKINIDRDDIIFLASAIILAPMMADKGYNMTHCVSEVRKLYDTVIKVREAEERRRQADLDEYVAKLLAAKE